MSVDVRHEKDGSYLANEAVHTLNERHGWFQGADAQSDVSRAFANNAVHAFLESAREAQEVLGQTGLTPRQIADQRDELLDALQLAADYIDGPTAWTQEKEDVLRERLYAAIAKATGQPHG